MVTGAKALDSQTLDLFEPRSVAHSNSAALASLERQMADLELDLAITLGELRRLRASARLFEQRAVAALRQCDEDGARGVLIDRDTFMSEAGVLEADVRVLRAILTDCRDFLRAHTGGADS